MKLHIMIASIYLLAILQPHTPSTKAYQYHKPIPIVKQLTVAPKLLTELPAAPFPYSPPETYSNPYPWGQCTWLVASMKGNIPVWGNADQWADGARAMGIPVMDTPIVGSVGMERVGNHVVLVTSVNGDGTVTVEEGNYDYNGSIRSYTYPLDKFIYIYI